MNKYREPVLMTREQKEDFISYKDHDTLYDVLSVDWQGLTEEDLASAWLNTELIKIEEPKRYRLKSDNSFDGSKYFNFRPTDKRFKFWSAEETSSIKTKFTEEEIAELADLFPEVNFDELEKVDATD